MLLRRCTVAALALASSPTACILDSQEAERVTLPVVVDGTDATLAVTDLGYEVELTRASYVLEDLQFTTQGEQSKASSDGELGVRWIRTAWAHPGHLEGGEVIGELDGRFIFDWIADDGVRLGDATMLTANYDAINFSFARAQSADVSSDDALLGHSMVLEGVARRETEAFAFVALIDQDDGRAMVGGPFRDRVRFASAGPVPLRLRLFDAVQGESAFDQVEFSALPAEQGVLRIASDDEQTAPAHNRIRNALQRHPFYGASLDG